MTNSASAPCRRAALAAAALLCAAPVLAQRPPAMECGKIQSNLYIRCTAYGLPAFAADHHAVWTDVPAREALVRRYAEESECHAETEATCQEGSRLPSSYSNLWTFAQTLGSKGCEQGQSGNGWVEPYLYWRAAMTLPPRYGDKTWLLTIVTSAIATPTIRAYPDANAALAPCHLFITGAATSRAVAIARAGGSSEQRQTLSTFSPGDYVLQLQCPAIQGTECRRGKTTLSLEITASPDER